MQDPEAEDEIERLRQLIQIECVERVVVDLRVEQLPDCGEPLAPFELDAPAGADPLPVLLVVDRDDPPRPASLGEERIEAVEGADVEHAQAAEVLGQGRDPVTVITGDARRVELAGAVEGEGVEPERDSIQDGFGRVGIGVDRQEIRDLALGGGWFWRDLEALICGGRAPERRLRLVRPGVALC